MLNLVEPAVSVPLQRSVDNLPSPAPRKRRKWPWVLGIVGGIGLFFMLLVPEMCAPRESANRIKCASNLRQIGLALGEYANQHHDRLPRDWADLVLAADITSDVFVCPTDNMDRAPGKTPDEWGKQLDDPNGHHCSYLYAGNGLTLDNPAADEVLAFEPLTNHDKEGVNLLFADRHVDWADLREKAVSVKYDKFMADYHAGVRPLRWEQ